VFQQARTVAHTAQSSPAPPQLAALRKSLLKMAKQRLGFEDSGGPKSWRVEVPGQDAAAFAALAGRAGDDRLATFVKRGAYYHAEVSALALFGCAQSDLQRWFKREGVGIEIDTAVTLRYKPSDATLAVLGEGEIYTEGTAAQEAEQQAMYRHASMALSGGRWDFQMGRPC